MEAMLRPATLLAGAAFAAITAGLIVRAPWATALWPFAAVETRLGFIFLGSIAAAIAASVLWAGVTGEMRAAVGGAINLVVTAGGWLAFAAALAATGARTDLVPWIAGVASLMAVTIAVGAAARRVPWRDARPMPPFVRASFAVIVAVLVLTAMALILRVPTVFPWPLAAESSVSYGWIFLGAATYFIYGLLEPKWSNAKGQLLGFLAYDAVLVGPFLAHLSTVRPAHRLSLTLYLIVLAYGAIVALYGLIVMRRAT
jgi:hypothetical protein